MSGSIRDQTDPSHAHVSARSWLAASVPPKRTTLSPSVAMACPLRAGGPAPSATCVQFVPSHSQVSSIGPFTSSPPNRTTLFPSVAMAGDERSGGLAGGLRQFQVPSHSHVTLPPNRTTLLPRVAIAGLS